MMLKESFILTAGILVFSALLNGLARLIETLREIEKERTWKQKI
jgi:hypothetical protein